MTLFHTPIQQRRSFSEAIWSSPLTHEWEKGTLKAIANHRASPRG
ncbi:hypothetical protein [Nostoc sp.]